MYWMTLHETNKQGHSTTECFQIRQRCFIWFSLYFGSLLRMIWLILAALKAIYLFECCCYWMRTYCGEWMIWLILAALKAIYLFECCRYWMRTYCGPTYIPCAFVTWYDNMLSFCLFVCLSVLGTILTFLDRLGIVAIVNLSFACLENITCCAFTLL